MNDNIGPCPFCGSDTEVINAMGHWDVGSRRVSCKGLDCLALGPVRNSTAAAVAAWNRAGGWIKIPSNDMPEEYDEVQVFSTDIDGQAVVQYEPDRSPGNEWVACPGAGGFPIPGVTHWRPLPPPPTPDDTSHER